MEVVNLLCIYVHDYDLIIYLQKVWDQIYKKK